MSQAAPNIDELKRRQNLLIEQFNRQIREHRISSYKPYPKQYEFHAAVCGNREVLFRANSQGGKTYAAAAHMAIEASGMYPDWWPGIRRTKPIKAWVVSESLQFSRDNAQRLLLGEPGEWGTGMIPKDRIVKIIRSPHSVADVVDMIIVRHISGGHSQIYFKSADQGREKLQGATLDFVWLDEESPMAIYIECLARTTVSGGPVFTTFTPLKGSTELVNRFLIQRHVGTKDVHMTIYDALHFTPEQREREIQKYPEHMRKARAFGEPILGSGAVYTIDDRMVRMEPFAIPDYWPRICGMDVGWTHPMALAWWAVDPDTGICYLYDCHRQKEAKVGDVYTQWKARGDYIPIAWPQDGDNETAAGAGVAIAQQYREAGMLMIGEPAMLPETDAEGEKLTGRKSVEAQVQLQLQEMHNGRYKVFSTLAPYWEEHRLYHRDENGKIVKLLDDVLSAARYGWTMRRMARTRGASAEIARALNMPQNWRT